MPLIFGAICPHPPILIPNIGRENLKKIKKTRKALENLEADLYSRKPETIVVISPHGSLLDEAFTINHSPVLKADFGDFGDMETNLVFKNDIGLAYQLRESVETKLPVVLITEEKIDYGAAVPLYYLTSHLKDVKIIPIGYSLESYEKHWEFGRMIRNILDKTNKRVAIIASGDLSHRLNDEAPAGYSAKGKQFDKMLIDLLTKKNIEGILKLDQSLIAEAGECGFRSLLILLGAFSELNFLPKVLSYEGPFGVGYLVANLEI